MSDVTVQNEPAMKAESSSPPAPAGSAPVTTAAASAVPTPSSELTPPAVKNTYSGDCAFNDSITIFAGNPLPVFDKGPVKAFAARGTDKAPPNLFAMICEDYLTPRSSKASNYAAILNPSLVRLVASGPIDWAPAGKQKYCFIYENVLGNPLIRDDIHGTGGIRPEVVLNGVIKPFISVLQDMRDKDIVHGNIRASNIFDGGNRSFERCVFGECLALPVSYNQPSIYEPIDRALASPAGRGTGTIQDDIYSFGVSLAMLMRHTDPTEGLSDEEIVVRKMEDGTYSTLLGRDRFSGAILELLRGTLHDDDRQRWNIDDILVWADGRRLSPKQATRRSKAARPLLFNGEKYIRPELLARDLNKNVPEARQLVDNGEMEQWLIRALEDKAATARYETAVKQAEDGGKGTGYAEQLVTRVGIALHPEGPMRYKGINVFPDGVGVALVEAYLMKRDLQSYIDFFLHYFITQWVDAQSQTVPDVGAVVSKFDSARAFLRQKNIGSGLEKCLYVMNPEVHCLSDKLAKFHVRSPEDMMHAFEKISRQPGRPAMFFDRHIIAFLSVKDRKNIDPYIHELSQPEAYKRILAEMKTLATIQKRSQMQAFPGIAGWIIENLPPVYERFHDRDLRDDLRKKVDRLKESGDLAKIVVLFDNPITYQEDNISFRRAMRDYHDLEQENVDIHRQLRDESSIGKDTGRQVAAVVSGILAGIIILATAFTMFGSNASPF